MILSLQQDRQCLRQIQYEQGCTCVQVRVAAIKREEDALNKEKERLEAEKARHVQ